MLRHLRLAVGVLWRGVEAARRFVVAVVVAVHLAGRRTREPRLALVSVRVVGILAVVLGPAVAEVVAAAVLPAALIVFRAAGTVSTFHHVIKLRIHDLRKEDGETVSKSVSKMSELRGKSFCVVSHLIGLLQHVDQVGGFRRILVGKQCVGSSSVVRPPSATDAMHIVLRIIWVIKIDYEFHVFHI